MDFNEVFIGITGRDYKSVGERMKAYENEGKRRLTPSIPVIITVDGKNTKNYASFFSKPFNDEMEKTMEHVALKLCAAVQNVKIAYSSSDKVTLVVVDPNDQMWFNGNVQDVASMVSSLATFHFNDYIRGKTKTNCPLMFRTKVFQVPRHEITNVLIWKQREAMRASMDARALYVLGASVKGKSSVEKAEMLLTSGFDPSTMTTAEHRGFCVVKEFSTDPVHIAAKRTFWGIDDEIPIFSADKAFVDFIVNGSDLKEKL